MAFDARRQYDVSFRCCSAVDGCSTEVVIVVVNVIGETGLKRYPPWLGSFVHFGGFNIGCFLSQVVVPEIF